jgi:UDPglucose 6-dehydrogenase
MKKNKSFSLQLFVLLITSTTTAIYTQIHEKHSELNITPKRVCIIGSGYAGLIAGAGLAEIGHNISCFDIVQEKISNLQQGIMPIYEPDLHNIIIKNMENKRLSFSMNVDQGIRDAEIIIICVCTPTDVHGEVITEALDNVIQTISKNLFEYKVICIKSTVPIGTCQKTKDLIKNLCGHDNFDVVSNPEFLREGSALSDFFERNPIVLGSDTDRGLQMMQELYQPFIDNGTVLIKTNFATSESIKYAWNSFGAIKIAYVDQLSHLCNAVGADIEALVRGISFSEKLLPMGVIKPGPGIGGSCLPKDTCAFISFAQKNNLDCDIVQAAMAANTKHTKEVIDLVYQLLNNSVTGKTIAVLGLAFKANTDDIRSSPAIYTLNKLLGDGAIVKAYDPHASKNMQSLIADACYCESIDQALEKADALLLLTDWEEFKTMDLQHIGNIMKQKIIVDTRNIWAPELLKQHGFTYKNLGRIT